ncbi:Endonuclease V [Legionella massiliensis]|uniref:Endonuclease V n=1 Tax=Legionella massiliensis TaxID=1034943 RepID=A0A078KW98_9GAMM|nr:deoxyribonuclease V [Legionella massiliensis]CDZ76029.1 Endonuclease V [Legionella massiliensis]CEE11767.1 Endonuclease V [Legionella massiliensis]
MNFISPSDLVINHRLNTKLAIDYQKEWAKAIKTTDTNQAITTVAGVDIAYDFASNRAFAIAVVLDAESLAIIEVKKAMTDISVPYRSGFLSFREVPSIALAIEQLQTKPDLIVCDGQGIAHPRRFGLACHLGLVFDIPTIGCGKSRLYGKAEEPGAKRGDFSNLYDKDEKIIGAVLRTRSGVKPLYISVGHKISLTRARELILQLAPKYRLPETTRLADRLAAEFKLRSCSEGDA